MQQLDVEFDFCIVSNSYKKTPQQLHFTMSQTCVHCWCFYLFMSRKKNEEEATMPSSHKVDIAVVNTRIMLQTF